MLANAVTITGKPKYYESLSSKGNTVRRGFCPECGTPVFAGSDAHSEYVGIKPATLDDPSWFHPGVDIWTGSAQPWAFMNPDIPKFEKDLAV